MEGNSKTLEQIQAEFKEIPISTDDPEKTKWKDMSQKILQNNYKLCLMAECFEERAKETKNESENDPTIELLRKGKAELEVLKEIYEASKAETNALRVEMLDLRDKRAEMRFFEKNRQSYVDFREKFFPRMMQDTEKMRQIIDELNKSARGNTSEKDLTRVTKELEEAKKKNEALDKTEEAIIQIRKQNEEIELSTCRIQVRNIEMETEIRSYDEYVLENSVAELQEKIKALRAEKTKCESQKALNAFKNPNDFPTLLDFLDKSKKQKQMKKKRKLSSPFRPPSKRRKHKASGNQKSDSLHRTPSSRNLSSPSSSKSPHESNKKETSHNRVGSLQQASTSKHSQLQTSSKSRHEFNKKETSPKTSESQKKGSLERTSSPINLQLPSSSKGPKESNNGSLERTYAQKNLQLPSGSKGPKEFNNDSLERTYAQKNLQLPSGSSDQAESNKITENPQLELGDLPLQRFPSKPLEIIQDIAEQVSMEQDACGNDKNNSNIEMADLKNVNSNKKQKQTKKKRKLAVPSRSPSKRRKNKDDIQKNSLEQTSSQINLELPPISKGPKGSNKKETPFKSSEDQKNGSLERTSAQINLELPSSSSDQTESNKSETSPSTSSIPEHPELEPGDLPLPIEIIQDNNAEQVIMEQENDSGNIEIVEEDLEVGNSNNGGEGVPNVEMSNSFERLFCTSPTSSGNLELNQSFEGFNLDNSNGLSDSKISGENENSGADDFFNFGDDKNNKNGDDFFNFGDDKNKKDGDDFFNFGDNSFQSNEGKADDFF